MAINGVGAISGGARQAQQAQSNRQAVQVGRTPDNRQNATTQTQPKERMNVGRTEPRVGGKLDIRA